MTQDAGQVDYSSLRSNVKLLGRLLGETVASAEGDACLALIERIRQLSKAARRGETTATTELLDVLHNLPDEQLVPVARSFSQFLNLANIAEQYRTVSRELAPQFSASQSLDMALQQAAVAGHSADAIENTVNNIAIDLVLTAHPTEITRRSLIHKHREISRCLTQLERADLTERELQHQESRLRELLAQIWFTHDFRRERPTPVDEARWGFAVLEDSIWDAVPAFVRELDSALEKQTGRRLPHDARPVRFSSWIGSDRDGNPNVTARVTERVLRLSRWQAADLYQRDLNALIEELSMIPCTPALQVLAAQAHEPYRAVLRPLRDMMRHTIEVLDAELQGEDASRARIFNDASQLLEPLEICYQSLCECGMQVIANGALLDLIRRARCFGVHLVRHDIRQESGRHTKALSELTQFLQLGDYAEWDEVTRCRFLTDELDSRRPLIPIDWTPSDETQEVLDTFRVIAQQPASALGAYVISMASHASDVLAVHLLLKATGTGHALPVAPLFETLSDLESAPQVIDNLLTNTWFKFSGRRHLMVMIGYSDSAKDAGVLAASWAQYTAQEALLAVCEQHKISLQLFHGRGGTIGRGGAPARAALLSQPPGSLRAGLRVTEQGEMIRTKLGLSALAVNTLALYAGAICSANLQTPPAPKPQWRELMREMAASSCEHYRAVVQREPDFVRYFRYATPEQELAKLPLGSRPARRRSDGGISSLRAIPWIFAWMQNRLMLPAWLGAGAALSESIASGNAELIAEMRREWPFFNTRISMLEMVFTKSDPALSAHYDATLVPSGLAAIGERLRTQLAADISTVLTITGNPKLMSDDAWARESVQLRNVYTDPLNYLQAELLRRTRESSDEALDQALMVTIAGIAAGMRNTG